MKISTKKHIFSAIFFAFLAIRSIINAILGSITLINNQANLSFFIMFPVILMHFIIPLILTAILIFHIMSFYKSDLSSKSFNIEFWINIILTLIAIPSYILFSVMIKGSNQDAMLIFIPIIIGSAIAIIASITMFLIGFFKTKK